MSRIGKQPVVIQKGVKVTADATRIHVEGPKGKLELALPKGIIASVDADKISVTRANDEKQTKSSHGTIRAIVANMIKGAAEGYKKELDVVGTGFKAQVKGTTLNLLLGFSHPVDMKIPAGLKVATPNPNRIIIEGADKQLVGEFAANVRKVYPPEPYKGKGVRYVNEEVRKKLGKALAK